MYTLPIYPFYFSETEEAVNSLVHQIPESLTALNLGPKAQLIKSRPNLFPSFPNPNSPSMPAWLTDTAFADIQAALRQPYVKAVRTESSVASQQQKGSTAVDFNLNGRSKKGTVQIRMTQIVTESAPYTMPHSRWMPSSGSG